jgi:hypothetical protein
LRGSWLVALCVLAAVSARADASFAQRAEGERRPSDWTVFAPRAGRFSVELPGHPAVERDSTWTPVGSVHMTKYWMRVGDTLLAVEVHDIPPIAASFISDDRILDQARDSLLRDVDGTLVETRALEFAGSPARDFTYRMPGSAQLVERVLAVLVARRLYLVTGMARAPEADPQVARFFASFRCWREAAVTP